MRKKLTKSGNSLALVLDKKLLAAAGIDSETVLEVSTDGQVIVLSPVRAAKRTTKLKSIVAEAHERYAGVFKKLAE